MAFDVYRRKKRKKIWRLLRQDRQLRLLWELITTRAIAEDMYSRIESACFIFLYAYFMCCLSGVINNSSRPIITIIIWACGWVASEAMWYYTIASVATIDVATVECTLMHSLQPQSLQLLCSWNRRETVSATVAPCVICFVCRFNRCTLYLSPVFTTRVDGPSWRVTGFHYPSTRAVLTGARFH